MLAANYKNKKALKDAIGKPLRFQETSMFSTEYKSNGTFAVVGPSATERKWYANVTVQDDVIVAVK